MTLGGETCRLATPPPRDHALEHGGLSASPLGANVAIILPAKELGLAKTRLAQCLSPSQRQELSLHMFLRTLRVARTVSDDVFVVSRDKSILRQALAPGVTPVVEEGKNLNGALRQAAQHIKAQGHQGALVLPCDIPLLTPHDVRGMLSFSEESPIVVIAPSLRGGGTNGLLVRPMTLMPFLFGPRSFSRHMAVARCRGVNPIVYRSETLSLDLDVAADWQEVCVRTDRQDFRSLIGFLDAALPVGGIESPSLAP